MKQEHIVLVFLRDKQVFGEIIKQGAHEALIQYDLDGETLTEWFSKDDYFNWFNMYFNIEDDLDG